MGYIYARAIDDGRRTLDQVPKRYRKATIDAYFDLFGIWLEEQKGK